MSRRHVRLDVDQGRLRLEDLESKNGTRVNGLSVREAYLEGGETIAIGGTLLRVTRQSAIPETALPEVASFGRVVGISSEMRRLYPLCERLAASTIPVIIEGETGTGKELLAEAIHERSPRAQAPFVVFDCTTVAPTLIESELFGHVKGAFTGATAERQGLFRAANGGTLLIDEIGDLDLGLQAKLLRVIERHEIRAVGSSQTERVDVRILAATRRDLDQAVQRGEFRDDLFHRLAVGRVELPPLRRRRGDIPILVKHLAEHLGAGASAIPTEIIQRWEEHSWPGNVRELANAVARYLALGEDPATTRPVSRSEHGDYLDGLLDMALPYPRARDALMAEFTSRYVERALTQEQGNVAKAAAASGVGRRYFQMLKAKSQG